MSVYINAATYFLATTVMVFISIFIFDLITKYKIWVEITKGNMAVSLATGGIVLGVANIMQYAINSNDNLLETVLWGAIGTAALLIVYIAFEFFTPKLNVSNEIGKGNIAVGFISLVFSLAFSFIIGASIS